MMLLLQSPAEWLLGTILLMVNSYGCGHNLRNDRFAHAQYLVIMLGIDEILSQQQFQVLTIVSVL